MGEMVMAKKQAAVKPIKPRTIDGFREEISAIESRLAESKALDEKAQGVIDDLALSVYRGDPQAKKKFEEISSARASESEKRRMLEAALENSKAELLQAQAEANREAARERMKEARRIVDEFRGIGAEIDDNMRKVLAGYQKIQTVMAQLTNLGVVRFSGEVVRANVRRAMRSSLISIHRDLELPLMPPLERRTFDGVVTAWVSNIERMIAMGEGEAPAPQVDKAQA
jgi:hypothetical protein